MRNYWWILLIVALSIQMAAAAPEKPAGARAIGLPEPPQAELIREIHLGGDVVKSFLSNTDPELERWLREIRGADLLAYRPKAGMDFKAFLERYEPDLFRDGWKVMAKDLSSPRELQAIYIRPKGLAIISQEREDEVVIIHVAGGLDLSKIRIGPAPRATEALPPAPAPSRGLEEIPAGDPKWDYDATRGIVLGERKYRPMTISAAGSGKIIATDLAALEVRKGSPEVILSYKKIFVGSSKERALEMERRCQLQPQVSPGRIELRVVRIAVPGSPASEVACDVEGEISIPEGWSVEGPGK